MACKPNPNYSGVGQETDYFDSPYYDDKTGQPCIFGANQSDYLRDATGDNNQVIYIGIGLLGLLLLMSLSKK